MEQKRHIKELTWSQIKQSPDGNIGATGWNMRSSGECSGPILKRPLCGRHCLIALGKPCKLHGIRGRNQCRQQAGSSRPSEETFPFHCLHRKLQEQGTSPNSVCKLFLQVIQIFSSHFSNRVLDPNFQMPLPMPLDPSA